MTRENTVNVPLTSASEVFDLMDGTDPIDCILKRSGVDDSIRINVAYALIADRKSRALSAAPLHEGEGEDWSELERLATEATPGPWVVMDGANSHVFDQRIVSVKDEYSGVGFSGEPDAAFIAAANPATILKLIASARSAPPPSVEDAQVIAAEALSRKQEPGVPTPGAWVEWSGGPNPVPGRNAEVKLRSGDCFTGSDLSPDATWQHIWGEADIIAYRIVPTPGGEGE